MKRRRWLQSMAALGALPAAAQTPGPESPQGKTALKETCADAAAGPVTHFFSAAQFATLRRLADLIAPQVGGRPGALAAQVPEFLDFLVSVSPSPRQQLYKQGLDRLNEQAQVRFGKPFAEAGIEQARLLLAPLGEAWSAAAPSELLTRFLREAKEDILKATVNSREFATAMSRRTRAAAGVGVYWLPLD